MKIQDKNQLQEFITAQVIEVLDRDVMIEAATDLTKEGIDSLTTVELIVLIEDGIGVQIDDGDLVLENFKTVHAICALLVEKYGVLAA